jgi:serine/threonine-protein kinase
VEEVFTVGDQLLDLLAAAHSRGIIHRDIKPENIFVTQEGQVKVLDFGIARLRDGVERTSAGLMLGTPDFMSPEQASGSELDGRSDLWAAAATMFTLLSGEVVHKATNLREHLFAVSTQSARSLATVAPKVPPQVVNVIDRALQLDPRNRWADARQMQDAWRWAYRSVTRGGTESLTMVVAPPSVGPAAQPIESEPSSDEETLLSPQLVPSGSPVSPMDHPARGVVVQQDVVTAPRQMPGLNAQADRGPQAPAGVHRGTPSTPVMALPPQPAPHPHAQPPQRWGPPPQPIPPPSGAPPSLPAGGGFLVRQGGGALAIQVPQAPPAYRGPSIPDVEAPVRSGRLLVAVTLGGVALLAALAAFSLAGGFREQPRVPLRQANPGPSAIPNTSLYVDPAQSMSTAAPVAAQAPQGAATASAAAVPSASTAPHGM